MLLEVNPSRGRFTKLCPKIRRCAVVGYFIGSGFILNQCLHALGGSSWRWCPKIRRRAVVFDFCRICSLRIWFVCLKEPFFFSCCVLVQRLLEHGFVCVGPSGRFIRYPVDFISRPCRCRVWFLTDLFVVDLVCLARKSLFFLLCFNVRVVGTWICMRWQSIHAHYLILDVSRFVDVCRFQKFGSQVNVDWYLYQSLW
jgi:hypothetical protein